MTAKGANTGQKAAKKTFWSRKKSLMQYPGGVAGQNTFGSSARLIAEEMNTLSYLVRKYPREAMLHLSSKTMQEEIDARSTKHVTFVIRNIYPREDSDCGNTQT